MSDCDRCYRSDECFVECRSLCIEDEDRNPEKKGIMGNYKTALIYLVAIVGVNFMFAHTGPTIGALFVGIVFVLRDYVQREIGHKVLLVMLAACVISYFMASPVVATASLTAFLAAELADWLVFTVLPFDFHHRVLFSSVIGVAVDTLIFLPMIGVPLWPVFVIAWGSKMVAASCVFGFYKVVEC